MVAGGLGCPGKIEDDGVSPPRYRRLIRCRYRWARSYAIDRFDSASIRAEEQTRLGKIGRLGVFAGLAGAAGNALFGGAKQATLSWGYAAGLGYAATQGFVPDPVQFAYWSGTYAYECVIRVSDEAWLRAPRALRNEASFDGLRAARKRIQDKAGALDREIERVDRRRPPISEGSQLNRAMRLRDTLTGMEAARVPGEESREGEGERLRRYEEELASALVSATDAVAIAINNHVDRVTPTLDQIRDLAAALQNVKAGEAKAKEGETLPASGGRAAKPAEKAEAAAATPTKPAEAAVRDREDYKLQIAINEAVAAAGDLAGRMRAANAPDFAVCVPRIEEAGRPVLVPAGTLERTSAAGTSR